MSPGLGPVEFGNRLEGSLFGDYELIEEIAHGGMGVVYKARQIGLDRVVALKMILRERISGEQDIKRFLVEAQAAAKLQHPNIVAIHEVGSVRGQYYYSMDYVAGPSMAGLVREHPLAARTAAEYVQKVAQAIHYAHTQGVLHRDLKPGNVLVDPNDQPRVTDFGLAKLIDADSQQTLAGTVMGTPSYMSPEQAGGQVDQLDARSDVYSLGAVLYELLTGTPPFRGETTMATLKLVLETEPVPPRRMNPKIAGDLETICLRALEKQPERRYSDAAALAEDLRRFLRHEPILARPIGWAGKLWRWCKRKPALAGVGGAAVSLVMVIAIGSPIVAFNLNHAKNLAAQRELSARRNAYAADMAAVQESISRSNFGHALQLLRLYLPEPGQLDLRNWEWRYFWQQCQSDEIATLTRHESSIYFCQASQTGKWVASESAEGTVKIWSIPENREVLQIETGGAPGPAFSPNDLMVAIPTSSGAIRLWDLTAGQELSPPVQHPGPLQSAQFSLDGQELITFAADTIRYWRIETRSQVRELQAASGIQMSHSRDAKLLAVSNQEEIVLWQEGSGILWTRATGHNSSGSRSVKMRFSPNGEWLALAYSATPTGGWTIRIINTGSGDSIFAIPAHHGAIEALDFSSDGKWLASVSTDQTAIVWDTHSWRSKMVLKGHNAVVHSVSFLPGGDQLVTAGQDRTVKLWNVDGTRTGEGRMGLDPSLSTAIGSAGRGAIAPDHSVLVVVSAEGEAQVIDPLRAEVLHRIQFPFKDTLRVATGPNGSFVAAGRENGWVTLWDPAKNEWIADLEVSPGHPIRVMGASADGRWLAVRSVDGTFSLWDMIARTEVRGWRERSPETSAIRFSPNNRLLACGHEKGAISLWDVEQGRRLGVLEGHQNGIILLGFSGDSKRLASTSYDRTARVWDVEKQAELAVFSGSNSSFFHPLFSPDGSRLFLVEWGNASLFDVISQRCVARLESGFPVFLNRDAVLGLGENQLWHWQPATLAKIDALESGRAQSLVQE